MKSAFQAQFTFQNRKKKMYEIEEENWKSKIYEKNSNI